MAYNVLKGNVQFINSDSGSIESMVDDYSNQTIAGIKTFSNAITSSAFFDSTIGAQIIASPITTLFDAGEDRVAVFSGSSDLTASSGFTYNQTVLAVTGNISASFNVSGSGFYGSGVGLTGLPAANITGQVSAANINIGNGLHNNSTTLAVSASDSSMTVAGTGISINGAGSTSGLVVGGSGIRADPSRADGIAGGSLAGADEFLVADNDQSSALKKATITNLQTYMQSSLSFGSAAGSDTQVQFNSSGDFAGDNTFTFNSTSNVLSVSGLSASLNVSASAFYGDGANITNVNATSINGNVPAGNLNIGKGLFNDSNSLAVSASFGLTASANGLEVTASATSGLNVLASTGLVVAPIRATTTGSVADGDLVLITDVSDSNATKAATMTTLAAYMQDELTFTGAGGSNTQVQYNNSGQFAGSSTFTFNAATNTLTVQEISSSGNISGSNIYVADKIYHSGDPDTFINFTTDDINIQAGGVNFIDITQDTVNEITFNEEGADIDFRVEGDSNTHLLYVNGGTNKVGIGGIPDHTLTVAGDISASINISASAFYGDGSNLQNVGGQSSYGFFTANYTVATTHDLMGIVTTGSAITASLPAASNFNPGQRITFKDVSGSCSGSNHIVISASAYGTGDRIDGVGVVKIQVGYGAITLASDGVGSFYIVSAT